MIKILFRGKWYYVMIKRGIGLELTATVYGKL